MTTTFGEGFKTFVSAVLMHIHRCLPALFPELETMEAAMDGRCQQYPEAFAARCSVGVGEKQRERARAWELEWELIFCFFKHTDQTSESLSVTPHCQMLRKCISHMCALSPLHVMTQSVSVIVATGLSL